MTALSPAQQAIGLASAGDAGAAVRLLDRAAAEGDGDALLVLGLWRTEGRLVPRDLALARELFGRAAEAGHVGAARIQAGFVSTGTGGPADWREAVALLDRWSARDPIAARQRALIATMDLDAAGDPRTLPPAATLAEAPLIRELPGLFSVEECGFLIDVSATRFRPATIFHEGEARFVRDPLRTSDNAGFALIAEWPAVHALNRRIAAASGTDVRRGEPLQVLRYAPGQEYRPHLDAVPGLANQRVQTVLVYLNDAYDGGETRFDAGVTVRGRAGGALIFANVDAAGRPDPASRHAGLPVRSGVKLVASRWIRARAPDAGEDGVDP